MLRWMAIILTTVESAGGMASGVIDHCDRIGHTGLLKWTLVLSLDAAAQPRLR